MFMLYFVHLSLFFHTFSTIFSVILQQNHLFFVTNSQKQRTTHYL